MFDFLAEVAIAALEGATEALTPKPETTTVVEVQIITVTTEN